jgi:hypothetical protein
MSYELQKAQLYRRTGISLKNASHVGDSSAGRPKRHPEGHDSYG